MVLSDKSWIIVLSLAIITTMILIPVDVSDNVGLAAHPIYTGFGTMTDTFGLYSDLVFTSADTYKTLQFSASDDVVYKTAYVSIDGKAWQSFTLTGNAPLGNWFQGSIVGRIDIPKTAVPEGINANNYVVVYSCSRINNSWDCHDNLWQISTFNTLKVSVNPSYSIPYVSCVTANNYDVNNGALPEYSVDNNLSDVSRWSGYGDGAWIKYDFFNNIQLTGVNILFYKHDSRVARFSLEYSLTGTSWTKIGDYSSSGTATGFESFRFNPITAKYFRIIGHGNTEAAMENWTSIIEVTFTNSTTNVVTCNPLCTTNAYTISNTCSSTGICQPTCTSGYGNCDGNNANGCETNLLTSTSHCGSCGNICPSDYACVNNQCTPLSKGTGNIYYLSPTGNDQTGDGSLTKPWFTLNKAWSVMVAGDTTYMREGTYRYNTRQTLSGKSGTADKMINIWAYPGENPVISPSSTFTDTVGVSVSWVHYLYLKGLGIAGFEQRESSKYYYGIATGNVNNCIFEQLDVHHNGFGLTIGNWGTGTSSGNLVLNSDFHHNSDPLTVIGQATPWGGSDGLTIRVNDSNSVNTISGCRMWWNSDDGIDLWANEGMIIINNSWAFWNGFQPGNFLDAGDGNGFKLGPTYLDGTPMKRKITNNMAFQNKLWGYVDNAAKCNMEVYNNVAYQNCYKGYENWCGGYYFYYLGVPIYLKNNIAYNNSRNDKLLNVTINVDHNSWDISGITVNDNDFVSVVPTGVDGPRKPDGSLPDITFMHLKSDSDLINKGVNVGLPYKGSAPDLGAFETSN